MDVANTLDIVEADGGTGALIHDPIPGLHLFHFGEGGIVRRPIVTLPRILHSGPETAAPIAPVADGGAPTTSTETNLENQTGLGNAGGWANAVSGLGPDANILGILQQSAGKGGANLQLGPQLGFAPAGDPGSSNAGGGGGIGVILLVALAIVGALVYYHFKKHKGASEAKTA